MKKKKFFKLFGRMSKNQDMILQHQEQMREEQDQMRSQLQSVADGQKTQSGLSEQTEHMEEIRRGMEKIGSVGETVDKLKSGVSRHDMVLEDLLEGMEDLQKQEQKNIDALRSLLESDHRSEVKAMEKSRERLLDLVMVMQDQMQSFARLTADDPVWGQQASLMESKIRPLQMAAGLTVVMDRDVAVDYNVHEVQEVVKTVDPQQDATVADVFSCGYVYMGQTLRKARVSAYRYVPDETETKETEQAES
ncbi:MAG: hypothetical protein IJ083_00850 [Clostridia bacterium]|nr:hypothetical protein [Clostridia bacterium]